MAKYDIIVVGARCAGSSAAMLAARRGYKVLLVDRVRFPSDTISTHLVKAAGVRQLHEWGLLKAVLERAKCPPIRDILLDYGHFRLQGETPRAGDIDADYCPRRLQLDKILIDAAVQSGAEVREGSIVESLLFDQGRVCGIRGRSQTGAIFNENAAIVIGADGLNSTVAREVQAPCYDEQPAQTCYYYTYWAGLPVAGSEIYVRDRRFMAAFPISAQEVCVLVVWPNAEFHALRANIGGNYLDTLRLAPALFERAQDASQTTKFFGASRLPGFFRKPYGPGWALVGDAGFHQDPITTQGMAIAFRDSALLIKMLDLAFCGTVQFESALAEYEAKRNQASKPIYDLTCQLAQLKAPSPKAERLLLALRENHFETNRFLGVMAGTIDSREFFAPENIQRIVGGCGGDKA